MTEHLPECHYEVPAYDGCDLDGVCVCRPVRACEARVEQACHEYEKVARQGQYLAGLTAAREAVAAVSVGGQHFWSVGFRDGTAQALAAIDALKEEP